MCAGPVKGTLMIFSTNNGRLDAGQAAEVDALGEALKKPGAKLLIHLHGGLVKDQDARDKAAYLTKQWALDDSWTQAYFVWHTGVLETIGNNWTELAANDRLYNAVLKKLIAFVARKIGVPVISGRAPGVVQVDESAIKRALAGDGDKRAPFAIYDQPAVDPASGARSLTRPAVNEAAAMLEFQTELARDEDFRTAVADIDAYVNAGAEGRGPVPTGMAERGKSAFERLSGSVKTPIRAAQPVAVEGRRGAVAIAGFLITHAGKIALRCFLRFRNQRDHGLHATVVEELAREMYGDLIGATIWGMMVKDAGDHFTPGGFGQTLIDQIPDDNPVTIVVTAHSAGAILAAQLLLALQARGKAAKVDLVLLAPAVRCDLFAKALTTASGTIGRCRMFTMTDDLERVDAVLGHDKGYIYPSSLLYLVSGLFEERAAEALVDAPLAGMQRFMGAPWLKDAVDTNASMALSTFFQAAGRSIVYSPSPGQTTADSHGGFDTEPLTLASVAAFIRQAVP